MNKISTGVYSGDHRFFMGIKKVVFEDVIKEEEEEVEKELVRNSCVKSSISCSEESSSIGKNSTDLSENSLEKSGDIGEEVQSSYKGPLDAMEALEEVLPIRRGISRFYNGKSKSFANLAEASSSSSSSSSTKDLAKTENTYARKRRNLLACNLNWDKSRNSLLRGNGGGGISKRVINSSRTTLALAVTMNNEKQIIECNSPRLALSMSSMSSRNDFSSWRSFSLADLQHCVSNSNEADLQH